MKYFAFIFIVTLTYSCTITSEENIYDYRVAVDAFIYSDSLVNRINVWSIRNYKDADHRYRIPASLVFLKDEKKMYRLDMVDENNCRYAYIKEPFELIPGEKLSLMVLHNDTLTTSYTYIPPRIKQMQFYTPFDTLVKNNYQKFELSVNFENTDIEILGNFLCYVQSNDYPYISNNQQFNIGNYYTPDKKNYIVPVNFAESFTSGNYKLFLLYFSPFGNDWKNQGEEFFYQNIDEAFNLENYNIQNGVGRFIAFECKTLNFSIMIMP